MKRLNTRLLALPVLLLLAAAIQLTGQGDFWTALRHTDLQGHGTAHIDSSRTNTFPGTRTLVTMIAGAAVAEGVVRALHAPLASWVPEHATHPQGSKATLAQPLGLSGASRSLARPLPPTDFVLRMATPDGLVRLRPFRHQTPGRHPQILDAVYRDLDQGLRMVTGR